MRFLLSALLLASTLSGCTTISPGVRESNANRLAFPVFMLPRTVTAAPFQLKAYERVHERGGIAQIYIEGEGNPWVNKTTLDWNPTPKDPVALSLAAHDSAKNVVWLARPCQYRMGRVDGGNCSPSYLGEASLAPEVLESYNLALNDLKKRYGFKGFNVIGYGGGGGIATLLTAHREDVLTLRTVAGLLDTQTYARYHGLPETNSSLNPINVTPDLVNIPQHHYVGQLDQVMPDTIYHSYAQALNDPRCLSYTFVQEADHNYDWGSNWPALLKQPATCTGESPDELQREERKAQAAPQIGKK